MPDTPDLIDTEGRIITRADVDRALNICTIAGMLGMTWAAMGIVMPLTMFMEAIGASGVLIGMLTTVRLLNTAMQIPAALFSERFRSRKTFFGVTGLIHRSLWFGVAGLALCWKPGAWWLPLAVLGVVGFSDAIGQGTGVTWFSWMTDIVPGKTSGRFWGRRQSIITFVSLAGMALAGYLMDTFKNAQTGKTEPFGFALVFAIAAACGVGDIAIHLVAKEPMPGVNPPHHGLLKRILIPLRNPDYRLLLASMGIWTCGITTVVAFAYVYVKRYFPVTYSHISALGIAFALGGAVTGFMLGSLIDRVGARKLSLLLFLVAPLVSGGWFFVDATFVTFRLPWTGMCTLPQVIVVLAPAMFVMGSAATGVQLCQFRLLAQFSSPSGRTVSASVYWASVGVVGGFGSLIGGCLMDWFTAHPIPWALYNGTGFSFFHVILVLFAASTWLVALPLLLRIRTKVDPLSLTDALRKLRLSW